MEELIRKRARTKAKLMRIIIFVQQSDTNTIDEAAIHIRLDMLSDIWSEFDSIQTQIECSCLDTELSSQQIEQEDFELKFCDIKAKLMQLSEIKLSCKTPVVSDSAHIIVQETRDQSTHIRLPKIDLPTFYGEYQQWVSFSDLFVSVIDNNLSLSKAQKLHYLKSAVKGDAARLLYSIAVTDSNYNEAWKILNDRYSNKRQIVQSHLKLLYAQPKLVQESHKDIRRLIDTTVENIRALHALGLPTDQWDYLMTFLLTERLDPITRRQWELLTADNETPSFDNIKQFLEKRCRALEAASTDKKTGVYSSKVQGNKQFSTHTTSYHATTTSCVQCKEQHPLFKCNQFIQLSIMDRIELVKKSKLCFNCLRAGHSSKECRSSTCKTCHQYHNTLLHKTLDQSPSNKSAQSVIATHHAKEFSGSNQVLLATAMLHIVDHHGKHQMVRALLDSGSQASFISESCFQHLQLPRSKSNIAITGLGASGISSCKGVVQLHIASSQSTYEYKIQAFILPRITENLPLFPIDHLSLQHTIKLHKLQLADPKYHRQGQIDILLGADIYFELMLSGTLKDSRSNLTFQNTTLGWIVAGSMNTSSRPSSLTSHLMVENISKQLQQFWELEELPRAKLQTAEEIECEQQFSRTYTRTENGRFVVELPFTRDIKNIGNTQLLAKQRLLQIEKRLQTNSAHKENYISFMTEYESLGHMELITQTDSDNTVYHLPHHYVLREQSTSTKLRVVFDGSAQPSTGLSLNQTMLVGPTIQEDLVTILTRFRMHSIVFTGDISKMYRQILVHPKHCDFQRIVWRTDPTHSIQQYRLKTLTYGTAAAPFLAIRCLFELASIAESQYPLAAAVIKSDFYVDDVLSGTDTIHRAKQTISQLIELLNSGGFQMHKWASNSHELLDEIPVSEHNESTTLNFCNESHKTLGINWNSCQDQFTFKVTIDTSDLVTKRIMLSQISKLFDPLGWIAPVVLVAKLMIQKLWLMSTGWDEPLPHDMLTQWNKYVQELPAIAEISIKRQLTNKNHTLWYQLHGFSDASEAAYSAVVYLRSLEGDSYQTVLVCSKSRISPLKRISLPRLELCGALLLAKLLDKVGSVLQTCPKNIFAWTDSTIVLSWLNKQPHQWKTFVANRVTEVQALIPPHQWRHIRSEENPADCLSRGMSPSQLKAHKLWWNGPNWLSSNESEWPTSDYSLINEIVEAKTSMVITNAICLPIPKMETTLIERHSSFYTIIRITAYCCRFINNCKEKQGKRKSGWLTVTELDHGEMIWIRHVQRECFKKEIQSCETSQPLHSGSSLISLSPFLDENGILRVGGRLQQAKISYNHKHPAIMPHSHTVTELIIIGYHLKYLHAGPDLLLAVLRMKYWIINARQVIRKLIHKCIQCFKNRVMTSQQLMGNLPQHRVEPARPFVHCGIDYAGPILTKTHKGRGNFKVNKAYICIFICFATRAIHIELVGDLTTQSFIAALRRFTSRRGKPSEIYSDCGTNFIGACRELRELQAQLITEEHNDHVSRALAEDGINWRFNPPAAPHFGGLWEAGVKSIKYHQRRTIGLTVLTFEELYTLLTQVEACLNSRPICPLSGDPDDVNALTPGHFLIGDSLNAIPDQTLEHLNINRLSRWQLVQRILHQFWKRWTVEYLSRLQQRPKWTKGNLDLQVGDLVLVKETNLSPLYWPLARIIETHPGKDNLVRTVTLKTQKGLLTRPIVKCCPLPVNGEQYQTSSLGSSE